MWLLASKRVVLVGLSLAVLAVGSAPQALAQSADAAEVQQDADDPGADTEFDSDLDLPKPADPITIGDDEPERMVRRRKPDDNPYDPLGLRLGTFTVFPVLEIGAGVAVKHSKAKGTDTSALVRLRPSFRAVSDWSRHQFTVRGETRLDHETGNDAKLAAEGGLAGTLRLDVRRGTTLEMDTGYTASKDDTADAALEHTWTNAVALTHDLGGIEARLRAGATRRVFGDVELSGGGTEDNADRAHTEFSIALRGSLTRDAVLTPFVEAAYEPRIYDQRKDRNGIARSSQGLRLSAGIAISDDPVWSGEVAANLLYRSFEDSVLDDAWAPGVSAAITWQPTDLTRFEFNAAVSLEETVTAGESTTARWAAGYTVAHNLHENLTVSAGVSLARETGGSDTLTLGTELGLTWAMNRNVVLGLNYNGEYKDGEGGQDHSLIGSIILRR